MTTSVTGTGEPLLLAPPSTQHPRPERIVRGRAPTITGAFVVAGFAVAMLTAPPPETPSHVAERFIRAIYEEDLRGAWDLLCRPSRDSVGYESFAETLASVHDFYGLPSDVDVSAETFRSVSGPFGPALEVAVTVTTTRDHREEFSRTGRAVVVVEEGALRVCLDPEALAT